MLSDTRFGNATLGEFDRKKNVPLSCQRRILHEIRIDVHKAFCHEILAI